MRAELEERAKRLRNRAAAEAYQEIHDGEFIAVTVSRQRRRNGKQTREIGLFVRIMVNVMHKLVGKPRYDFVAKLANVAFRNADLGAEEVRQNCRRARTGTLAH
jgi:hypothetical protein